MHRLLVFLIGFALCTTAFAREEIRLDSGWRFKLGEAEGAELSGVWDKLWPTVSVPHNWGWEDAQQGREYYRGPGWYRRELDIAPVEAGKRYFLRFGAAGSVADVYLNGKHLGQHRGAFGAFCFEITHQLSTTGTNTLAVRVSNAPEPDIAPLTGDFPVYGGLYRPVHLIVTGGENFTLTDHGSPGVAWLETSVTETQAVLDVTAQISNTTRQEPVTFVATVFDANGQPVAASQNQITPTTNSTAPYSLRVVVPQPHLWNGRSDPYLYKAVVELRAADAVLDSVEQPLGLRYYAVDPEKGFFLNGRLYDLHGVCRHQDRPDKGWAITEADQDEDIELMKELGCTVVRCAHYQHSDYFYSLCDKAGILVWAEIPQVNSVHGTPAFEETSRNQLLDLIRQSINHPSIFAWSLFNEVGVGAKSDDPHRELQDLKIVANGEDPTRPTIAATCTERYPQMNKIPDWLGWNFYPGWYTPGGTEVMSKWLDERRDSSRHGGFCVSEYGAGANVTQHEQNPKQPVTTGQWHPEEWQAIVHEADWAMFKSRPYIWGTFVWNMFDFTSYFRHEGAQLGRNDKGLVTYDRKTKKDAFYFYKANWSDEPTLYITSRRFTARTNAVTDVKVYSNAAEVKLLINGVSQGTRTNGVNGVFIWKDAHLKPGENQIEAQARRRGQAIEDRCVWTLASGP
ncbi:MAG TPA: glycoside hydrolase family 2 TIM barrel-domain containing protein [Verrucomicrobiae bacterium]|nr:glycoside hydrolase family 2 TIM barrel-domain containing protein [Verrucomicrobiae bacterium]